MCNILTKEKSSIINHKSKVNFSSYTHIQTPCSVWGSLLRCKGQSYKSAGGSVTCIYKKNQNVTAVRYWGTIEISDFSLIIDIVVEHNNKTVRAVQCMFFAQISPGPAGPGDREASSPAAEHGSTSCGGLRLPSCCCKAPMARKKVLAMLYRSAT